MPPKAAKGKGEKKKEEPPVDDGAERELVEKELVIGYLKSKLGRYQDTGDKLQIQNLKLNDELDTQKLNLRDINEFLTNELKARSLTTSALEAKVNDLNHTVEELRKNNEEALKKQASAKDKQIEVLQAEIEEYEKKNKMTQEFLERKDAMEAELDELKVELSTKVKEYEQRLTDMDRQHIQDREKWKRDTAAKIKETKIQMMKLTDNQLEMTTKRTIMENEQMSIELSYQSRQTEKLLKRNACLVEDNSDLRRQLDLSKQTEEEMAKRNNVYQKTIKSLLTKLKDQNAEQQESGHVVTELDTTINDLESRLHLAELQNEEAQYQLSQAQIKVSSLTGELDGWSSRFDSTSQFLMKSMDDVKEKVVTIVREESSMMDEPEVTLLPGRLDDLSPQQRERILAYLLEKMHIFVRSTQLEGSGQPPRAAAGGSRGGQGVADYAGVLPPIPAFSRRNLPATTPISQALGQGQTVLAGGKPNASQAFVKQPEYNQNELSHSMSHPSIGIKTLAGGDPHREDMQQPLPAVDDLLSKVMSDVRPWGKRSNELPLTKNDVFLKKGATSGRGGGLPSNKSLGR